MKLDIRKLLCNQYQSFTFNLRLQIWMKYFDTAHFRPAELRIWLNFLVELLFIVLNSTKTSKCLHVIEFIESQRFQNFGRVSKFSDILRSTTDVSWKKMSRESLKQFYNVFVSFNFVSVSFIWKFPFYSCASTRFSVGQLLVLRRKMKRVQRIRNVCVFSSFTRIFCPSFLRVLFF